MTTFSGSSTAITLWRGRNSVKQLHLQLKGLQTKVVPTHHLSSHPHRPHGPPTMASQYHRAHLVAVLLSSSLTQASRRSGCSTVWAMVTPTLAQNLLMASGGKPLRLSADRVYSRGSSQSLQRMAHNEGEDGERACTERTQLLQSPSFWLHLNCCEELTEQCPCQSASVSCVWRPRCSGG